MSKTFVISLGGSLIVPDEIDTVFLSSFRDLIREYVAKGDKFFLITGGGKVCRRYQAAAGELVTMEPVDLDWLGIHVTHLNAQLVRFVFKDIADEQVVTDPTIPIITDKPVAVGAGWKPGWSSDYDAVEIAFRNGATHVVNLSNTTYVYTADPKTDPTAQPIKDISWADYRNIIPKEWTPGLNAPFDPIASKLAQEHGITVAIMNGSNLDNLRKFLNGESFEGTLIH